MTRYADLCGAYFAREPSAIEAIFRELPQKMKQALSDNLTVPATPLTPPSLTTAGRATSYVELCRYSLDQNGQRTWEICPPDDCLWVDRDGICHFTVGISLEQQPGAVAAASMLFLEFTIESVDEQSAALRLIKPSHEILIDLRNPDGYDNAADLVTTYLLEALRDRSPARGLRGSLGY
jgi:hypothetical protein